MEVGGEESDSEVGGSSEEEEENVEGGGVGDVGTSEVGSEEEVEEGNVPKDDDHEEEVEEGNVPKDNEHEEEVQEGNVPKDDEHEEEVQEGNIRKDSKHAELEKGNVLKDGDCEKKVEEADAPMDGGGPLLGASNALLETTQCSICNVTPTKHDALGHVVKYNGFLQYHDPNVIETSEDGNNVQNILLDRGEVKSTISVSEKEIKREESKGVEKEKYKSGNEKYECATSEETKRERVLGENVIRESDQNKVGQASTETDEKGVEPTPKASEKPIKERVKSSAEASVEIIENSEEPTADSAKEVVSHEAATVVVNHNASKKLAAKELVSNDADLVSAVKAEVRKRQRSVVSGTTSGEELVWLRCLQCYRIYESTKAYESIRRHFCRFLGRALNSPPLTSPQRASVAQINSLTCIICRGQGMSGGTSKPVFASQSDLIRHYTIGHMGFFLRDEIIRKGVKTLPAPCFLRDCKEQLVNWEQAVLHIGEDHQKLYYGLLHKKDGDFRHLLKRFFPEKYKLRFKSPIKQLSIKEESRDKVTLEASVPDLVQGPVKRKLEPSINNHSKKQKLSGVTSILTCTICPKGGPKFKLQAPLLGHMAEQHFQSWVLEQYPAGQGRVCGFPECGVICRNEKTRARHLGVKHGQVMAALALPGLVEEARIEARERGARTVMEDSESRSPAAGFSGPEPPQVVTTYSSFVPLFHEKQCH